MSNSALSSHLFTLFVNDQDQINWCMCFTDDVILINEGKKCAYLKLEIQKNTLAAKGFELSKVKNEGFELSKVKNEIFEIEFQ